MNVKPRTAIITTVVTALAIVGALGGYVALTASASSGSPTTTTSTSNTSTAIPFQYGGPGELVAFGGPGGFGGRQGPPGFMQNEVNLTTGQTITVTSTSGEYFVVGSPTTNGTASGAFTFTVTGKLSTGYILSISGSVTVDGQTYTVSSGTAQMTLSADSISGQGTTSSSGAFAIQAQAHGSFVGSSADVTIDLSNGTTEYAIILQGTA